jgi:hypothetical protein
MGRKLAGILLICLGHLIDFSVAAVLQYDDHDHHNIPALNSSVDQDCDVAGDNLYVFNGDFGGQHILALATVPQDTGVPRGIRGESYNKASPPTKKPPPVMTIGALVQFLRICSARV